MDRDTVDIYEERGLEWAAKARPVRAASAREFAKLVAPGSPRADIGCGAGRYTAALGTPVLAVDAARSMLDSCRQACPDAQLVQADLEELPFARRSLGGAWANMSYLHVPRVRLPLALADLHAVLSIGAPFDIQVLHGDYEGNALEEDEIGGRFFASWHQPDLIDVVNGAGFTVSSSEIEGDVVRVRATRARTLADTVGPDMSVLMVGLNPSLYAADAGVGFARPGNRFWPAALEAGLVSVDRDARHALIHHGLGMTDLVKRATTSADQLSADEYAAGMARVERLVQWLGPVVVCFVGLSGWRAARDRSARPGLQEHSLGRALVYVMPSTSGANAHAKPAELSEHLRKVKKLAEDRR